MTIHSEPTFTYFEASGASPEIGAPQSFIPRRRRGQHQLNLPRSLTTGVVCDTRKVFLIAEEINCYAIFSIITLLRRGSIQTLRARVFDLHRRQKFHPDVQLDRAWDPLN